MKSIILMHISEIKSYFSFTMIIVITLKIHYETGDNFNFKKYR